MTTKSIIIRTVLVIGGLFLLLVLVAYITINRSMSQLGSGPEHVFVVQPVPAFLTEELAVDKAREALALEGLKTNEWAMMTWGSSSPALASKAPDGRMDTYLLRRGSETNAGVICFTKPGEHSREYRIRLEGDRVTCSLFRGL